MFQNLTRWAITVVVGAIAWTASAGPASAQYFPGFGGGFSPFGGSPFMGSPMWGSPYMMGSYNRSFVNPYTGGMFNYQYSPYGGSNGYSMFNPFTGRTMSYQAYVPYYAASGGYGSSYGGGYSAPSSPFTYGGSANGSYGTSTNRITAEQLRRLRAASYQSRQNYNDDYSNKKQFAVDRKQKAPPSDKPANVKEPLVSASEKEVQSGQALNALVAEIRTLRQKGAKADVPLFPAEILSRAAFQSTGSEKAPPPADAVPKWSSAGATATELLRHLEQNKLEFAPAPTGAEEAYSALYRGLSSYYVGLAQAKK